VLGFEVNTTVKKFGSFLHPFFGSFLAHGSSNDFLILVKELWLLTNLVKWIRGVDVLRSYIYCIVNNEDI
jgi:hypothetical protein